MSRDYPVTRINLRWCPFIKPFPGAPLVTTTITSVAYSAIMGQRVKPALIVVKRNAFGTVNERRVFNSNHSRQTLSG